MLSLTELTVARQVMLPSFADESEVKVRSLELPELVIETPVVLDIVILSLSSHSNIGAVSVPTTVAVQVRLYVSPATPVPEVVMATDTVTAGGGGGVVGGAVGEGVQYILTLQSIYIYYNYTPVRYTQLTFNCHRLRTKHRAG